MADISDHTASALIPGLWVPVYDEAEPTSDKRIALSTAAGEPLTAFATAAQGLIAEANQVYALASPIDEDYTVNVATVAGVLVRYTGALTEGRTVAVDPSSLPASGARLLRVLHAGTDFDLTVDDDDGNAVGTVAPGEYADFLITTDGVVLLTLWPTVSGDLALLDTVGAAQIDPGAIDDQDELTEPVNADKILLARAADGLLYFSTIENILANVTIDGADQAPTVVTITGSTHTLENGQRAHLNVLVLVDNTNSACAITIPKASAAGSSWVIRSRTTNTITFAIEDAAGSIDGGSSATMTGTGREAVVTVESNAGSAPVVTVEGEKVGATVADGAHNAAGFSIFGYTAPFSGNSMTGSMAGAASGKSWKITGNATALPITDGWVAKVLNVSGSAKTIAPASGSIVGTASQDTGSSASVPDDASCFLHADGTNLYIDGPVTIT